MSDQEINIAIAEVVGWKDLEIEDFSEYGVPCFMLMGSNNTGTRLMPPDYCNDLNAMHEAENNFPHPSDWYQHNLALVCGGNNLIYRATARQRAEAFLRVFDKWKEAK